MRDVKKKERIEVKPAIMTTTLERLLMYWVFGMLKVVSGNAVSTSPSLKATISFSVADTLQLWRAKCDFIQFIISCRVLALTGWQSVSHCTGLHSRTWSSVAGSTVEPHLHTSHLSVGTLAPGWKMTENRHSLFPVTEKDSAETTNMQKRLNVTDIFEQ